MVAADPVLSICVPTFNRAWMLRRNLEFHLAAFRARNLAFEIVVVDDCSTDDTADYLASLATVPELSIFRRQTNRGFLDNYAFAMQRAQGRYAVFLGDDDLLIPDQIFECLALFGQDERIGMIQAPWLLVDERPGGGEIGPFYRFPQPTRIKQGDHARLSQFIFDFHVFPEFMIIRRDVLLRSISGACPFIFWAFLYTGRALFHGDVLFLPKPFARVTAMSADPRVQQGNREAMFQWDSYRGGIEYIASLARREDKTPPEGRTATVEAINRFMSVREKVALRLLAGSLHWIEAFILIHRIAAYEPLPVSAAELRQIGLMAAFTAAASDAAGFSTQPVIVDPQMDGSLLGLLRPELRARLSTQVDAPPPAIDLPRAFLRLDPAFPARLNPRDAVFTISDYLAQFS